MKVTKHGQNLHKLTRMRVVNMYIVEEEDGLTVVDTGFSGSAPGIIAAAEALGAPVRRITLTHAHADHAGSLDALRQALPQAQVVLHERTAEFLSGDMSLRAGEAQAALRGSYLSMAIAPDRLVQPGDNVGSLRVLAAPGHSPDQIAFLDERDGTLIAGDAFQTQGGFAVSGVLRWRFPLTAWATWHLATAVRSARELAVLAPQRLAVGHGGVLEAPGAIMARGIAAAEEQSHGQAQAA